MEKLIVIEGTTASGKSDLAVALAEKLGGEVVSADSRQVYRGLDLGTGKITPEEAGGIPHHLIDVTDPGQFFSLADYQPMAYEAVDRINKKGRVPILCGGTGLYVDAVAEGYSLSDKKPDLEYRAELETYDTPRLYEMLLKIEPTWDGDGKNRNRVMRRLEKIRAGDTEPGKKEPRYEVLRLACTYPRDTLRERIDERLDRRFALGMTEEDMREINEFAGKIVEMNGVVRLLGKRLKDRNTFFEIPKCFFHFSEPSTFIAHICTA